MVFARLLFPPPCALPTDEDFDEDDLYAAMDSLTGHCCAFEKNSPPRLYPPVSLALYDLTSVYFEGSGPAPLARYGHNRDINAQLAKLKLLQLIHAPPIWAKVAEPT